MISEIHPPVTADNYARAGWSIKWQNTAALEKKREHQVEKPWSSVVLQSPPATPTPKLL
jgi:hypothetical protein